MWFAFYAVIVVEQAKPLSTLEKITSFDYLIDTMVQKMREKWRNSITEVLGSKKWGKIDGIVLGGYLGVFSLRLQHDLAQPQRMVPSQIVGEDALAL